jgi:hypothetical protein
MDILEVGTVAGLKAAIAKYDGAVLYRGQTAAYKVDGKPSIVTSFDRHGCIPSQMLKWSRYAGNLLEVYVGAAAKSKDFTQALLQHYGWRSFYIDCSSNPAVSAWFASHVYSDSKGIDMCEDCEERPAWLVKRKAQYDFVDGDGHLYIFNKPVSEKSVGLIDLAAINIDGARPRTDAQDAWLLGPLRKQVVPQECLLGQTTGPRSVFRDFAHEAGLVSTNSIFPTRDEDPILSSLLSLPWKEIPLPEDGIPAYGRGLDIPEYQDSYRKISPASMAFYRGKSVTDLGSIDGVSQGGIVVKTPEIAFYGTPNRIWPVYREIEKLLQKHPCVTFEIDDLVRHVQSRNGTLYQKGVVVISHGPKLVEVCELMVDHPGQELVGAGINKGYFYRIKENGVWEHEVNANQCDCGNDEFHNSHFKALSIVDAYLEKPDTFS